MLKLHKILAKPNWTFSSWIRFSNSCEQISRLFVSKSNEKFKP